LIIKHYIEF